MIGTRLADRYEITDELGRGGMGVVYRGYDPLLKREVAIKLVPHDLLTPAVEARFLREAQVVAQMDHPAIVTVHDIGRHEGALFFVMPIVRGSELRSLVHDHALSQRDIVSIGIQIAEALDYSHCLGVVHRDIKPENVMVVREGVGELRVRVMDFGLAHIAPTGATSRITQEGQLIGTTSYFSPEQVAGNGEIDGRSDVYSLGTVLYECLCGEPPFVGDSYSVLRRIVRDQPRRLRARGVEIDRELEAIVMYCLAKDPNERPQRGRDVAEALRRLSIGTSGEAVGRPPASAAARSASGAESPQTLPFVGRREELEELARRREAASSRAQMVVIAGEEGIGKSRLLEEFERAARSGRVRVLHGRFVEQDRSLPYQGFSEIIQDFFVSKEPSMSGEAPNLSGLAPDLVTLFPALSEIPDIRAAASSEGREPKASRRLADPAAVFDLLTKTIARLAAARPLVLIFEDVHRADVSIDALEYAVRRLRSAPVLVVASYRPAEVEAGAPLARMLETLRGEEFFAEIVLGPLSPVDLGRLAGAMLGGPISEASAHALAEATGGNPFFARELVRWLVDSSRIVEDEETGVRTLDIEAESVSESLPTTIQQAVEHRIEGLPQRLREVLSIASVLGRSFEFRDLAILADSGPDLAGVVERLLRRGLLEEARSPRGDRLAFANRVVRDALYAGLSRRRRRSLHRRYAEHLESRHAGRIGDLLPQLAHHYALADDPEKAVEFGIASASRLLDAFSFHDADRALAVVFEFFDQGWQGSRSVQGEARLLLARTRRLQGRLEEALEEARQAARTFRSARRTDRVASAFAVAAEAAWTMRKVDETQSLVDSGLEAARAAGATAETVELLSLAATVANLRGDYDAARGLLEEADRLRPQPPAVAARGGFFRIPCGPDSSFGRLDPVLIQTDQQADITANVFETLTHIAEGARVVPWLASAWTVEDKGRRYCFRLREGVRFHDGRPLTARDVRYSFERLVRNPGWRGSGVLSDVVGAAAFASGEAGEFAGVQVVSDSEISVELERPIAFFPVLLTDACAAIVPEGSEPTAVGWRDGCVGTGPFRLVRLEPGRLVELERNPDYWREGFPRGDGLLFVLDLPYQEILSEFRAGRFSIASNLLSADIEALRHDSGLASTFRDTPSLSTSLLAFNTKQGPLADVTLRRRLARGVDVEALVRRTLMRLTTPATTLIPPSLLGHDSPRGFAGMERSHESIGGGVTLTAVASPAFSGRLSRVRDEIVEAFGHVGARVSFVGEWQPTESEAHTKATVDMILTTWAADYPDADSFAHGLLHSKAGLLGHFCGSPEIDALSEAGRAERNPESRHAIYRTVEDVIARDALLLPLFHPQKYRFAHSRVHGLSVTSLSFPVVRYDELWMQ